MKGSIQGYEIHMEAETAVDGYDLCQMLALAKSLGMDAQLDRIDNLIRLRIAAKIKSGPKPKSMQERIQLEPPPPIHGIKSADSSEPSATDPVA